MTYYYYFNVLNIFIIHINQKLYIYPHTYSPIDIHFNNSFIISHTNTMKWLIVIVGKTRLLIQLVVNY